MQHFLSTRSVKKQIILFCSLLNIMKIYVLLHSGRQFRGITKCPFVKTTQDVSDNINNFPTVKISYKIATQIKEKENGP